MPTTNADTPCPGSTAALADPLTRILSDVHRLSGRLYCQVLTASLTTVLGVEYAFVARRSRGNDRAACTVAVAHRGGPIGKLVYPLDGTPCADTLASGVCRAPSGARERYPADTALGVMDVESYLGVLLAAERGGGEAGWLAVMDTRPMDDPASVECVLRTLAVRTAMELERVDLEDVLVGAMLTHR